MGGMRPGMPSNMSNRMFNPQMSRMPNYNNPMNNNAYQRMPQQMMPNHMPSQMMGNQYRMVSFLLPLFEPNGNIGHFFFEVPFFC